MSTLLKHPPSPVAPSHDDMLADAFLYALGVTDNGRRKLTDADVTQQPNHKSGVPMWEQIPLTRLANYACRDSGIDNAYLDSLRKCFNKGLTTAQIRGAANVLLAEWKRGNFRPDWMVGL